MSAAPAISDTVSIRLLLHRVHRELLGKYAVSSGGGLSLHPLSSAPTSGTPRLGSGGAGPRGATPSYLSPAFQLAAMEQEVQMAHASAAAAQQGGGAGGGTPPAAPGWQADDASESTREGRQSERGIPVLPLLFAGRCVCTALSTCSGPHHGLMPPLPRPAAVYNALTATAKKLADKPSFMEAYRQKFPHISEPRVGLFTCSRGCAHISGHSDRACHVLHALCHLLHQLPLVSAHMRLQWRPLSGCCRPWRSSGGPLQRQRWHMRRQPLGPWRLWRLRHMPLPASRGGGTCLMRRAR